MVRLWNPLDAEQEAELALGVGFEDAVLTDLNEEPLAEAWAGLERREGNVVSLAVPPFGIVTVMLRGVARGGE